MAQESIIKMAQSSAPKKPEKSQAELRKVLEKRLDGMKSILQTEINVYEESLKDGTFEDQEDEPVGSGEARKEAMIKKINALFDHAEKMKETLESNKPLPQQSSEISATYNNPNTNTPETISFDLESKLQEFLDFYQTTNLDLPPDFPDTIRDIWNRNENEIRQAIEQNGFDEILILHGNIPLVDLKEKMKMENGYYEGSNFTGGGSFAQAVSQNASKDRIVLVHSAQEMKDRAELQKTLNILGSGVNLNEVLSLEDYLVFQRMYYEKTGKHLDVDAWTWLATTSGARLVDSGWRSTVRGLYVFADGLLDRYGILGARPSRCFF